MKHLTDFSYNLYGVTGALLLLVLLDAALRAMVEVQVAAGSSAIGHRTKERRARMKE